MNMEDSFIHLDDLPDEILMIIWNKLHEFEVLYSLIGVNKRLDAIVQDPTFTSDLTLIPPRNDLKQFADRILDRICDEVLPKIHDKIKCLNVESTFMDRILLAAEYPNLHTLALFDLSSETARDLFNDGNYLIGLFQYQLSSLIIHINRYKEARSSLKDTNIFIYTQNFTKFNNLKYLNFDPYTATDYNQLTFGVSTQNVFSSTLLYLRVVVDSYEDCLYLLDGRFKRLTTLFVTICSSNVSALTMINNKNKLANLKGFVLILKSVLTVYNTFLIPLLNRMSNLEELDLEFDNHNTPIIDGYDMEMNILSYMIKLKKFKFNIHSVIPLDNQVYLPSNEYIQNTFKTFQNNKIISSIDYFSKANEFHCHIYSYPYSWIDYNNITNNFRGGLFKCVRDISLFDERPFEQEFFLLIAKSFPRIEELILHNREPQKKNNQQASIIEYPHLIRLDLFRSHENYVEQFLDNTKTCLLNDIYLRVDYNSLQRVTDNFTRDATRINCTKVKVLILYNRSELSQDLKNYFTHAKIC